MELLQRLKKVCLFFLAGTFIISPIVLYGQSGSIQGYITTRETGDKVPGCNIWILGTYVGTASDIEGFYRLLNVAPGRYHLVFAFMGYKNDTLDVVVLPGESIVQDVVLEQVILEGKIVTVTAQLEGQRAAISQQIRSEQIVNIVSADRIKELPDQNAAESVGRLPGIAIQRNAGEGQKVLIRGLAPKYSSININGQRIPSTDATDRSVDLSMISSDILAGIEVYKALTPDQDADVAGGQVNFILRSAEEGFHGQLDVQTGYNGLTEEFRQYKFNGSVSDRFFKNRLGIIISGGIERTPYPSDGLQQSYGMENINVETGDVLLDSGHFWLNHTLSNRERSSANLLIDYDFGFGHIIRLSSFYSSRSNNNINYNQEYSRNDGSITRSLYESTMNNTLLNNTLGGNHSIFNILELDWGMSYASIINETPRSYGISFFQPSALNPGWTDETSIRQLPIYANNDLTKTEMDGNPSVSSNRTRGWDWSTQINVKMPFSVTNAITGYLKSGFKHRSMNRERRRETYMGHDLNDKLIIDNPGKYELSRARLTINNFLDPDFDLGDFMDGKYGYLEGIKTGVAEWLYETYPGQYNYNRKAILDDYNANETVTAGYVMGRLNIGRLMILSGVRYESTHNDYTGKFTDDIRGGWGQFGFITDTSAVKTYDDWLPIVHVRYDIFRNLALRLAFTRTLIRPDYENLVPTTVINMGEYTIRRGNPELRHTKAWNYDALISLYSSRLGLFTVGGFYKELKDIDYYRQIMLLDPTADYYGYELNTPVNAEGKTDVYGFEVELQTNLRFLPSPLDGIVISANYTRTYGHSYFPSSKREYGPPPYYYTIYVPIERKAPIPGQSDHIANVSIGFEKWGFSGRVSMVYQSDILKSVGIIALQDQWQNGFVRWDFTASQKLYKGLSLYWNVNNLANMAEMEYIARDVNVKNMQRAYTLESYYEWSTSAGFRYTL